jgi:ferredoxin-NADP reductase/predicted pyridoxine 5'-phosphate oxidase superfamily flavin-nucleotide-binding protein
MKDNLQISPFHEGEKALQSKVGKRDAMESFAPRVIRSYLPEQHQAFYKQLPFLVVGSVDAQGWPWASILPGTPGFMNSPTATTLDINTPVLSGDPLQESISLGSPLGLLGIEIPSRRRNRLNARISAVKQQGFSLKVDQAFGNCPQYIQTRDIKFIRDPMLKLDNQQIEHFKSLDKEATQFIQAADTFFVSSYIKTQDRPDIEGVDVSHRGGMPGFVKVEGNTLTIPDYSGNFHFNTLGNFLLNPKAGLIFPDFDSGDLLMLSGSVEILWEDHPEVLAFKGAERGWRFTVQSGVRLRQALPFRASFGEYSATSKITGDWTQAAALLKAETERNSWQSYHVSKVEDESSVIRSFYFERENGAALLPFKAGQFLTIRVKADNSEKWLTRTYTLSSAPADNFYRISVKREEQGLVSKLLHDALVTGSAIEAKAPLGEFYIDNSVQRPAVLMAGGVGITPMISMAQDAMHEGKRTRYTRPLTIYHGAQSTAQRAFDKAFLDIEVATDGAITYYSLISQPLASDKPGTGFNGTGHISANLLRQTLALDDYDFFLCGPSSFMQAMYDILRELGVRDARVNAEAFGPASLQRQADEGQTMQKAEEAKEALVKFTQSDFEQRWNQGDDTLLELAESHGLSPEFGCRSGACGSCSVKLRSGKVAYRTTPTAEIATGEVLICCAVPAKGSDTIELEL